MEDRQQTPYSKEGSGRRLQAIVTKSIDEPEDEPQGVGEVDDPFGGFGELAEPVHDDIGRHVLWLREDRGSQERPKGVLLVPGTHE